MQYAESKKPRKIANAEQYTSSVTKKSDVKLLFSNSTSGHYTSDNKDANFKSPLIILRKVIATQMIFAFGRYINEKYS